jgi:hypothetical protein
MPFLEVSNTSTNEEVQALGIAIKYLMDSIQTNFRTRLKHSGIDTATVDRVIQWFQENKVIAIDRYNFAGTLAIIIGRIDIDNTVLSLTQRTDVALAVVFEDHTSSVRGLTEGAEKYCGGFNVMMRCEQPGGWKATRLPDQEAPQNALGKCFVPATRTSFGQGRFNKIVGLNEWMSQAAMESAAGAGSATPVTARACLAALGFAVCGPVAAAAAFGGPELYLASMKASNGPVVIRTAGGFAYAAFRARTGKTTMFTLWRYGTEEWEFPIDEDVTRVGRPTIDVQLAMRDACTVYIG